MKSSSIQQQNCYCDGPGIWCMNMIQCGKCRRWYHDGCIESLEEPILCGDRFFVFICAICNSGSEFLCRIELKWVDVVHLVLYNLTVINKKKYYDFSASLMPFLNENWTKLRLFGDIASAKAEDREKWVLQTLVSKMKRFKNAKEIKKSRTLWGLRVAAPPVVPHATPVAQEKDENGSHWKIKINGRKTKILHRNEESTKHIKDDRLRNKGSSSRINAAMKNSSHINVAMKNSRRINGAMKNRRMNKVKSEFKKVPNQQNDNKRTLSKVRKSRPQFKDDDFVHNLLDTLIPTLPNFCGPNNPFVKTKKSVSRQSQNKLGKGSTKIPTIHRLTVKTPVIHKLSQERFNGQHLVKKEGLDILSPNGTNGKESTLFHPNLKTSPRKNFLENKFQLKNMGIPKAGGLSVKGRRVTTDGQVQYLFEWYT